MTGRVMLHSNCLTRSVQAIGLDRMDFMAVGVFQAIGSGKRALIFAVLRKIVLEIPAIILLNLIVPLYGMAFAQFVAEFVLAIAAVIMLNQIFQTKSLSSKRESKN